MLTSCDMGEIINWANAIADPHDDLVFRYNTDCLYEELKLIFENRLDDTKHYVILIGMNEFSLYDFYMERGAWEIKILRGCGIDYSYHFIASRGNTKSSRVTKWMEELSQGTITFKNGEYVKEILNEMYGLGNLKIEKVIFNKPATIVFWSDGTKTVVKAQKKEKFDKEKGLAMAISKKMLGTNKSKSNYYDIFKKWCGGKK